MNVAQYLDLANHDADVRPEEVRSLCQKVKKHGFHSAFVNACYVKLAKASLGDLGKLAKTGTVISFPLGQDQSDVKVLAAIKAVKDGADELDVSMNVGWFKAGKRKAVLAEMKAVVEAAKSAKKNTLVKFIIETGLLADEEIKDASRLVLESGADFVKTCSGFGPRGASLKDVALIKSAVAGEIKIKVAGGIHSFQEAVGFIKAGADRIGTSHAVEIVRGVSQRV